MKILFIVSVILTFFLVGCTFNSVIKDFPSRKEFYKNFNNSVSHEKVNITLKNDSSFCINNGIIIANDTLFYLKDSETSIFKIFAKSEISEIKYDDNEYKSAVFTLKTGENVKVQNIIFTPDSIQTVTTNPSSIYSYLIPIDKVKTVDFKDSYELWPLWGGLLGAIIGRLWVVSIDHQPNPSQNNDYYLLLIAVPVVGIIAGLFTTHYVGYQHYYHFNN
jgi:hypothetical protein